MANLPRVLNSTLSLMLLLPLFALETGAQAGGSTSPQVQLAELGLGIQMDREMNQAMGSLVVADLQDMTQTEPLENDAAIGDYEDFFGGRSKSAALRYFSRRVHYLIPSISNFELESRLWLSSSRYHAFLDAPDAGRRLKKIGAGLGALNVGATFYLLAAVNRATGTFRFNQTQVPLDSPRAGIMMLGPKYQAKRPSWLGLTSQAIPAGLRQSILVHEARHSDCGSPLNANDIEVARSSRNAMEFNDRFRRRDCGYLHVFCPPGHPFEGILACDDVPGGAYAVGAIYAEAMSKDAIAKGRNYQEVSVLDMTATDSASRLLYFNENVKVAPARTAP